MVYYLVVDMCRKLLMLYNCQHMNIFALTAGELYVNNTDSKHLLSISEVLRSFIQNEGHLKTARPKQDLFRYVVG